MTKKAQVTIFIILGLVILVSIVLIGFVMVDKTPAEVEATPKNLGPRPFIQSCVSDILKDSEKEILENGLIPNPTLKTMHNGTNISYHCYQGDYYKTCYNLHPMLEEKVEDKIEKDIENRIQNECFSVLLEDFENQGYDVSGDTAKYSVDLVPGEIRVKLRKPITISRGESSESFENFDTRLISPLYEFIKIARDITHSESIICSFEYSGYVFAHPDYRIYPVLKRDYSKIYQIRDTKTDKEFSMAVRSCASPSGVI